MEIADLSDAGLTEIFKRLPPYYRLLASEVCRRWRDLSRMPWLDVRHLVLDTIPSGHIGAIVKLCPNLLSVVAVKKSFEPRALHRLPEAARCVSVKLYDCRFETVPYGSLLVWNLFQNLFSSKLRRTAWNELILHNPTFVGTPIPQAKWDIFGHCLPSTLTHLQLTGLRDESNAVRFQLILSHLRNLECLVVQSSPSDRNYWLFQCCIILEEVAALKNLRELLLSPVRDLYGGLQLAQFVADMPKLEVLFLNDISSSSFAQLGNVITKPSALRILVLTGHFDTDYPGVPDRVKIRARPATLSTLNIFVGEFVAAKMHFQHSDKAIVYPIFEPMPRFLERDVIAPIFDGVWIAKQIKEAAKNSS